VARRAQTVRVGQVDGNALSSAPRAGPSDVFCGPAFGAPAIRRTPLGSAYDAIRRANSLGRTGMLSNQHRQHSGCVRVSGRKAGATARVFASGRSFGFDEKAGAAPAKSAVHFGNDTRADVRDEQRPSPLADILRLMKVTGLQ
jgi:hypothetical protein